MLVPKIHPRGQAPVIGALAIVMLGAMAFAVPSRIQMEGSGGFLVSHTMVSTQLADQLARTDYAYVAIDLTHADLAEDALWRTYFKAVKRNGVPVWGWVDLGQGAGRALKVLQSLPLDGLYVYGPSAVARAKQLRRQFGGVEIVAVVGRNDPNVGADFVAVALERDDFLEALEAGGRYVLIADRLTAEDVAEAREAAAKADVLDYLVAEVAILKH